MGEAFITRRGGGTGKAFAVIGVTYPEGSVCTCTNGSKTLRAKDTSGKVIFYIPYPGTWNVTISNGSIIKTGSVTVEEGDVVAFNMFYQLTLFDGSDGGDKTDVTGGWRLSYRHEKRISLTTSAFVANCALQYVRGNFQTINPVNLTGYTTLKAYFTKTTSFYTGGKRAIGINSTEYSGSNDILNAPNDFLIALTNLDGSQSNDFTLELDISQYKGEYFINIYFGTVNETCYKVELL